MYYYLVVVFYHYKQNIPMISNLQREYTIYIYTHEKLILILFAVNSQHQGKNIISLSSTKYESLLLRLLWDV